MTDEKNMGLRQKVKKGIVSIDEAIEIAKDYNESIQRWLKRRKDSGVKVPSEESAPKRYKKRSKAKSLQPAAPRAHFARHATPAWLGAWSMHISRALAP